ncbi:unnamed protein product [Allacma fusca]|uniref:Uncharacterized protein n=1 Tax=Allacma fusca TaxID=39272 RepID=A0A8J2K0B0_9HEXA|nr:unnamed protein product [Allacma fusca]
MGKVSLLLVIAVITIGFFVSPELAEAASGAYRKPPFNGSIFGKRSSDVVAVGDGMKGMSSLGSLCEIAMETCSSLYLESRLSCAEKG